MAVDSCTLDVYLEEVAREGKALSTFLDSQSYYQPSFRPGGLGEYLLDLPDEEEVLRRKLRDVAKAIYQLAAGPPEHVIELASSVCETLVNLSNLICLTWWIEALQHRCCTLACPLPDTSSHSSDRLDDLRTSRKRLRCS